MKRLILMLALSLLILGVVAGPALAWYDIKPHTAYVTTYQPKGWDEWTGPGPFDTTHHKGAIPYGYKVVLGVTWIDTQLGAKLAPVEFLHTFALHKVNGAWSRRALNPAATVRYWSPAYRVGRRRIAGCVGRRLVGAAGQAHQGHLYRLGAGAGGERLSDLD